MGIIFNILHDLGYTVGSDVQNYYSTIDLWNQWWKGYCQDFHKYSLRLSNGHARTLKRKQMGMAKKVCEDWADLLLNDKTRIVVDDIKTQEFLTGDAIEQSGGVFGNSKFWKQGNKAIEREFAQGTVCFYIQLDNPTVVNGIDLKAESLKIKVIKDAQKIIPLSYEDEDIYEIALFSAHVMKSKKILYVQIFKREESGRYEVQNYWYKLENETYTRIPSPNGEVESYKLPCKPFVILRPNVENNVSDVPMGISIYANAIDNLKSCDLAFDNLFNDVLLGKKKVFMNQAIVSMTPSGESNGSMVPDVTETLEKSLYVNTGEKLVGDQQFLQEYNPDLRIDENKGNIQFNLNLLSSKVGLGQRRYSFESSSMATATEVKVSNKDLTESVWKQRIEIQDALTELSRAILIIGKEKCGANVDAETKISIQFDDTMFNDEEAERVRMLQEISQGVSKKWEYRVKYYGEDAEKAKKVTGETDEIINESLDDYFEEDENGD